MATVRVLVTAHTDPVPGDINTPARLTDVIEETLEGRIPHYIDSVELVSSDLESDILHTNAIPLAEFSYLKEHSPLDVLELLRKVRALGHGETIDAALHAAILMISALNAVKVVGEAADRLPDGPHNPRSWEGMGS